MELLLGVFFFILGAIVGSFLNVVILRYHTGKTLLGRSHCSSCGRVIAWHDLIPILSFFLLRGRCRFCKSKLSVQYPLVEMATALLFLGVSLRYSALFSSPYPLPATYYLIFLIDLLSFCLLVVITAYDLKHKIIPNLIVYLFVSISFIRTVMLTPTANLIHFSGLVHLLDGPLVALPLFLLWLFSRGRWIGLGDAKLSLGIGWFLTLLPAVSAEVIGFWIGAIVGLLLIAVSKLEHTPLARRLFSRWRLSPVTLKSEMPLAPFLIIGLALVYFWGFDVTGFAVMFTT